MERPILASILAVGAVGWLIGFLITRSPRPDGGRHRAAAFPLARAFPLAAAVALLPAAVLALPDRSLWPAAQPWARGLVLGGVAALLTGGVLLRVRGPEDRPARTSAVAAAYFSAVAAAAGALMWEPARIPDVAAGVTTGWLGIALLLALGLRRAAGSPEGDRDTPDGFPTTTLVLGAGFAAILGGAIALGHLREVAVAQAPRWSVAALALAAAVPIMVLAGGWVGALAARLRPRDRRAGNGLWWRTVLAAALLAVAAWLISDGILAEPRLRYAVGVGLAASLALWVLLGDGEGGPVLRTEGAGTGVPMSTALPALAALAGVVAAFYVLAGYGVGVALLVGSLPAGLVVAERGERTGERVAHLLVFGALLLLYRLFVSRFQDDLSGAVLTDHFAIFSILAGAVMPSLLSGLLLGPAHGRERSPGVQLSRLALVVTAAVTAAAAVVVLWGARGAIGLLVGLALAVALAPPSAFHALLAMAIASPLLQWAHDLLQVAIQTRAEKVRALAWLVGIVCAALLAADYGERAAVRLGRRRARAAPAGIEGGTES